MATVMIQHGSARGGALPGDGQYLKAMDFERHDGRGELELTSDLAKAKRFTDIAEAMEFWRTVPKCKPRRDHDNRPNRPLTAANWEFKDID